MNLRGTPSINILGMCLSSILGVEPSKRRPIQNKGHLGSMYIYIPGFSTGHIFWGTGLPYFMAALLFHAQESWSIARIHQPIEKHILVKKCLLKTSSWYFEAIKKRKQLHLRLCSFSMLQRTGIQKKILDSRKFLTI